MLQNLKDTYSVMKSKTKDLSRKLRLGVLWKTIVEFGENTSFHGVKYMVSNESSAFEK